MGPLMTTNPLLGIWLGGTHAWTRMAYFWTGAWMFEPRRAREKEGS